MRRKPFINKQKNSILKMICRITILDTSFLFKVHMAKPWNMPGAPLSIMSCHMRPTNSLAMPARPLVFRFTLSETSPVLSSN